MKRCILAVIASLLLFGCGGAQGNDPGALDKPGEPVVRGETTPEQCVALWRQFEAPFIATNAQPPMDSHSFTTRCLGAGSAVLTCTQRCEQDRQIAAACMWFSARGCVQKHATAHAAREGVARELVDLVTAGHVVADARGWVVLPPELASLSLDGRMWVGRRPGGRLLLFLKTWEGRHHNVGGYLHGSPLFSEHDFQQQPDAEDPRIPRRTITLPDFPLESDVGDVRVGATFNVVENLDPTWIMIHWGLD